MFGAPKKKIDLDQFIQALVIASQEDAATEPARQLAVEAGQ
ncbi:hypothetical protein [Pseudofrankia sp. DC12]|nr:hypothetical protein [Pseudofrankia sp. DC12]